MKKNKYISMIKITKIFAFKNKVLQYLCMLEPLNRKFLVKHIRPDGMLQPLRVFFLLPYVKSFFMADKADKSKKKGHKIHTVESQIQAMFSKVTTWSNAKTGKVDHDCKELDPVRVGYR